MYSQFRSAPRFGAQHPRVPFRSSGPELFTASDQSVNHLAHLPLAEKLEKLGPELRLFAKN